MTDSDKDDKLVLVDTSTKSIDQRIDAFKGLLEQINTSDDKKKQLWREVYENAITDRQNSYVMFVKLATISGNKSTEHAVHGKTMATYIERMSKANDQLLKLADLIARSEAKDDVIDPESMFDLIKQH